jgi:hypothetical protein
MSETEITKDTLLIRAVGGSRVVHTIDCDFIKSWDISGCVPIDRFNPKLMKTCPKCESMVYVSLGAKDFAKNRKKYAEFFTRHNVNSTTVKEFYTQGRAHTEFRGNTLYIQSKKDNWKIEESLDGKIHLFHNNYVVKQRDAGDNFSGIGYHEHELISKEPERLYEALRQIINYDYEKAQQVHKKKKYDGPKKKGRTFRDLMDDAVDF